MKQNTGLRYLVHTETVCGHLKESNEASYKVEESVASLSELPTRRASVCRFLSFSLQETTARKEFSIHISIGVFVRQ